MEIYGNSDIGKRREKNEDSFRYGQFEDRTCWAVVCDGMGGAVGGEIASKIAADLVGEKIGKCYRSTFETSSLRNLLSSAIVTANVSILDRISENRELTGMGTTIVSAIVKDNFALIAHVGDSRAYMISSGEIKQITRDHSLVQAMLDSGQITQEEYDKSTMKNIILKCLGAEEINDKDYIDYDAVFLNKGDSLLLCSDGLSGYVDDDVILSIVESKSDIKDGVQKLIEKANENGGYDNITAVAIRI